MNKSNNDIIYQHIQTCVNLKINNQSQIRIDRMLSKNEKEFIFDMTKDQLPLDKGYSLSYRIYWFIHNMTNFPICTVCGKIMDKPRYFRNFTIGFQKTCCLKCGQKRQSVRTKAIITYTAKNNIDTDLSNIINVYQLPSVKLKLREAFQRNYGDGIINPGQFFNRQRGYNNYLKNVYVEPMFTYEDYNEQCKIIDRYHNKNLKWRCKKCGCIFKTNVKRKAIKPDGIHKTAVICPQCNHYKGSSMLETKLYEYVKSIYLGKVERCNRSILKASLCDSWGGNHEIDIWLPDDNKAIEFNGTYYHMDPRFYDKDDISSNPLMTAYDIWQRDKRKYSIFEQLGINYLIIWEYDWNISNDNCKKQIKDFLEKI